jgi:hypothetical protein
LLLSAQRLDNEIENNYYRHKFRLVKRTIKRLEKQEKVERIFFFGNKYALSLSKVRAALKKQTAGRSAKSYRDLRRMIQVHQNTVKKYLE